ncbi:MAG: class II aldolase/adducin family protein [Burkholderiales bacterium]
MSALDEAIRNLVIANRVLAHEGVLDAYGHVSVRHPTDPGRYLLSRSRSPELVEADDIIEFTLDGKPASADARPPYLERFIHGSIYQARREINSVVHSHADEVVPFSISKTTKLRPVWHAAGRCGFEIPVWDIADKFGDTNLLVVNGAQGDDLAQRLGSNRVVLMRGHGFAAAGETLIDALWMSIYLPHNARMYMDALKLGEVKVLSPGEIAEFQKMQPNSPAMQRAWEYWARRAGCEGLMTGT